MASRTLASGRNYSAAGNGAFAQLCRVHRLDRRPSAKLLAKNLQNKKNPDSLQEIALCLFARPDQESLIKEIFYSVSAGMRVAQTCEHRGNKSSAAKFAEEA